MTRPVLPGPGADAPDVLLERAAELSMLVDCLEAVGRSSSGQVLLVGGGRVGKTTLLRRFREARGQSARVLWGACDPLFTPSPLGPLLAVAEESGGELEAVVQRGAMPYEVVTALARELSARAPTVFVLEDVHWADEATLDVDGAFRRRSGSLWSVTTGGPGRDGEERPLRRAPQLAVLLEGDDRKGLLHDMTAAILRHGGDIVLVEIIERGARSVVYWELDGIDDPDGLARSFLEIDVVQSLQRLPTMYQVWGKRIIVVGAGAQVGQVAIGAIGEADRHNIRGEKISVDTIPIVGETNLANAVRAVARLPRAVAVVLAGSLMGGEVTRAVDEIRARGILVVSLNMAGSVPGHADLVVTDPIQAGVMAVMAVASTASFDITRVRGHHF